MWLCGKCLALNPPQQETCACGVSRDSDQGTQRRRISINNQQNLECAVERVALNPNDHKLTDVTKNSDRNSDQISPASDYQSNLNNLPQNREYDQQNDPDTLSRGQTRHRNRFDRQQSDNSDPLVNKEPLPHLNPSMKPQSLMKEERVLQPLPEIKPRSKTIPLKEIKQPQAKPRQKVKMPETENGPVRPVSTTSSCPASKDATKNSDRNSDHISPASDYQSNLNNLQQNREYDQQNDPDTLSRGQTRRRNRFDQQQSDNSDPLVNKEPLPHLNPSMKPQSLMKEERVLQPLPEIKPRSKAIPLKEIKQPQAKPRQKVKMPETENGPVRPVSTTSSCPASKDATKNSDRNSDHISPASDYQSNLNNLQQNREYDQQNDPDTLSRGQTRRRNRFDQQQSDNSDPLVNKEPLPHINPSMKPQSLMKEERVLQPPPKIKPKQCSKTKPRQNVKMPETENGPVRPVSATSSCSASKAIPGRKENALAVVAIDFGTTFSGYAYSLCEEYRKDQNKIYILTWQSGDGLQTYKTPTTILFDKDGKFCSFGYKAELDYAKMCEDRTHAEYRYFSKFKMRLYQPECGANKGNMKGKGSRKISNKMMLVDDNGRSMSALTVFSESIKYFKNHFLSITKNAGLNFRDDEIHWVLTIPAIWKDDSKQFMRESTKQAGIPEDLLTLAYEPEAAAIYCKGVTLLKAEGNNRKIESFKNGQRFLVLDCGGGTVDVTCYEVKDESHLSELESPTGGPWGGITVNEDFFSKLEDMFGEDVWSFFMQNYPEDVLEVQRGFESMKYVIKESSNDIITMRFPVTLLDVLNEKRQSEGTMAEYIKQTTYSHSVKAVNDKVRFKNDFIKECFTKSVEEIINHLKMLFSCKQLRGKRIGTILMVGGFSQSPVLYDSIKSAFPNMEVICPQEAVLAIVKGAVMFGNDRSLIQERISPRTYGICVNEPFDSTQHPTHLKSIVEGQEKCTDIFKIIVNKGQQLVVGESVFDVHCYPMHSYDTEASVEVYETSVPNPKYTIDDGVRRLGQLCVPIPDVSRGKCRPIKIEMHFGYTELFVTAIEVDTDTKVDAKFKMT